MAIEPVFEKINYNESKGELKEQIKVECKTDVAVSDVASILSLSAWSMVNDPEVLEGKIGYSGKAIFYLTYVDSEGTVKKAECGAEFNGSFSDRDVGSDWRVNVCTEIDKTEADTQGVKVTVKAFVTVKAETSKNKECRALVSGEELVVDINEIPYQKSMGVRQGTYPVEEEFLLSYPVKEVLCHKAEGVITSVQCGVGVIIVDGETQIDLIMLQKNEKSDIIKETRSIPFRMEIECEDAMPTMCAVARVKEKSFKTDIDVDAENGNSTVNVSVLLKFYGEAFSSSTLSIAKDVFSTSKEVQTTNEKIEYFKDCEQRTNTFSVSGRVPVGELPVGANLTAVCGDKAEIISTECDGEKLKLIGTICATAYLLDGDGKVFTRKLELPFETEEELNLNCKVKAEVLIKIKSVTAKIISLTEVDCSAEIYYTVYPKEPCRIDVIKEVVVIGDREPCDAAISVYIPTEGEELWSLAKRLRVAPNELVETNKELCFPLTGKERIVIYRQR